MVQNTGLSGGGYNRMVPAFTLRGAKNQAIRIIMITETNVSDDITRKRVVQPNPHVKVHDNSFDAEQDACFDAYREAGEWFSIDVFGVHGECARTRIVRPRRR